MAGWCCCPAARRTSCCCGSSRHADGALAEDQAFKDTSILGLLRSAALIAVPAVNAVASASGMFSCQGFTMHVVPSYSFVG